MGLVGGEGGRGRRRRESGSRSPMAKMGSFRAPVAAAAGRRKGVEAGARGAGANLSRYYCYSCYRLSSYNKRRSVAMYTRRHRVYIPHNVVYAIPCRISRGRNGSAGATCRAVSYGNKGNPPRCVHAKGPHVRFLRRTRDGAGREEK